MSVQTDTRWPRGKKNDVNRRGGRGRTKGCRCRVGPGAEQGERKGPYLVQNPTPFPGGALRYAAEPGGRYAGQRYASPTTPMRRFAKSSSPAGTIWLRSILRFRHSRLLQLRRLSAR